MGDCSATNVDLQTPISAHGVALELLWRYRGATPHLNPPPQGDLCESVDIFGV
jgi:hypothetical protein